MGKPQRFLRLSLPTPWLGAFRDVISRKFAVDATRRNWSHPHPIGANTRIQRRGVLKLHDFGRARQPSLWKGVVTILRQRKVLVQLYTSELMGTGSLEIADQVLAENVQFFGPGSNGPVRGRETFKKFLVQLRKAFPDLHCKVHAVVEEEDWVACWVTVHGTHWGVWRGFQPTGRRLELQAMNLFRFSGDRIIEVRAFFNVADYDIQLGKSADAAIRVAPSASDG